MSGQEMQRTSDRASKPQAGTPDIGAQPDPTPAVFPLFSGRAGEGGAAVAVWRLVPGKWLFGVTDGRTPGFHRDGWSPPYPASQGNRASSTAMARAVVSWGATRTGMAAGDVVRRARRARWLRP